MKKQELLDKAGREWGLEDVGTIELYMMAETCSYADMVAYYELYNATLTEDFGFEI